MRKEITPAKQFYCLGQRFTTQSHPPLTSMILIIRVHSAPAQFENRGSGLEGRLLAGLAGEDRQALLSWGHDCQGLHLPSPTGGLLEVDLQDILQLGTIQHIGNVED